MARRRSSDRRRQRDTSDIANDLASLLSLTPPRLSPVVSPLVVEDRRLYSPDPLRTPRVRVLDPLPKRSVRPSTFPVGGLSFSSPRSVLVCVRRKQRREVLHAIGRSGRNSSRRRRGPLSGVSCK